jgi:hypothetical protein
MITLCIVRATVQVRDDLDNPFGMDDESNSKVVIASSAVQEWKRQVAASHVHDMMTPTEKFAERELLAPSCSEAVKKQKVVKLTRAASSKKSMLDALEHLKF